jgi:hypothetical protein
MFVEVNKDVLIPVNITGADVFFSAPKPEVKTYTAEEVQQMLAQLQAGKEPQAV